MSWTGFWQMYGLLAVVGVVALIAWLDGRWLRGNEAQRLIDRFRLPYARRAKRRQMTDAELRASVGIINIGDELRRVTSRSPTAASRAARFAFWRRASRRPR